MKASRPSPDHRESGFTLLEVMIALLVSGLVMAGLTAAMATINKGWGTAVAALGRQDMVAGALHIIAGDIARIERIVPAGAARPAFEFRGSASELTYLLAERPGGGEGVYRIGLFLRDDPAGTRLVRARARYAPAGATAGWSDEAVLMRGNLAIRFSYRAPSSGLRNWVGSWSEARRLPEQIRLEIVDRRTGALLAPALVQTIRITAEAACVDPKAETCTLLSQGRLGVGGGDG